MNEIEVKARTTDTAKIKQILKAYGVTFSEPVTQDDRVYFHKDAEFDLQTGRPKSKTRLPALRIRQTGGIYLFTYKIPVTNDLDKCEYESEVSNPEAMAAICEELGFALNVRIHKVREVAHYKDYEICLDDVEGLGTFIEVEKFSDQKAEQVQQELWEFLKTLGIQEEDRITLGYDILMRIKKLSRRS